jgi:hypothetical protein
LDLVKGYHQVPVDKDDIPKTAVITTFGLFEYIYMPFGLKHAAHADIPVSHGLTVAPLSLCFFLSR